MSGHIWLSGRRASGYQRRRPSPRSRGYWYDPTARTLHLRYGHRRRHTVELEL